MVSTFTTNKNIEKPGHNDYPNTWDVPVNADWDVIDRSFGGTLLKNATGLSGTQALTITETQPPTIQISGAPTAAITYRVPAGVGGVWIVRNTTTGGFNVGLASAAGGATVTVPAGSAQQMWCDGTATGMLAVSPPAGSIVTRSYLAGLTLSNNASQPTTVLNIAAGSCANSTNTTTITLGAITKSTGGAWVVGSGQFGMGNGLVIAANTWYHVFAIINNSVADVYFDTSVNAANAPASTTAVRRIGSFKTNSLSQIIAFTQFGDLFQWVTATQDVNTAASVGPGTYTLNVPSGVAVEWRGTGALVGSAGTGAVVVALYTPGMTVSALYGALNVIINAGTGQVAGQMSVLTNTAQRIAFVGTGAAVATIQLNTYGWIDRRGQDS